MMRSFFPCRLFALVLTVAFATPAMAAPEPSDINDSWSFKFKHDHPRPIAVRNLDGEVVWYWYMTYQVQNDTGSDHLFNPQFDIATDDGQIIQGNRGIGPDVFLAIKQRLNNRLLESPVEVTGQFLQGADNARESVVIWKAPAQQVSHLSIFVAGIAGETQRVTTGRTLVVQRLDKNQELFNAPLTTELDRRSTPRGVLRKLSTIDLTLEKLRSFEKSRELDGPRGSTINVQVQPEAWVLTYKDEEHRLTLTQQKSGTEVVLRKQLMLDYELPGRPQTPQSQTVLPRGEQWVVR